MLSKQQKLVIALLAAGDLIVLVAGCVVVYGLWTMPQAAQLQLPTPLPTDTPRPTSIPTWTPEPTPTPYVPPTPTLRPLQEEEAAALDQTESEVAALRGLDPLRSVPRWKITRNQLRRRYADVFVSEEWEQAARYLAIALAALDFMPPDTDLLDLWRDGFSEGVAGFYVIETEEIFVVSDEYTLGAMERVIYAHEFGHALQDQHFDLESLGLDVTSEPEYADRIIAVQSLIEGDAVLTQEKYVELYFSQADAFEFWHDAIKFYYDDSNPAPRILGEISSFPYDQGREFVGALYERGGWQAVDDAYVDPPMSTEHILHPARYLAGDQPIPISPGPLTDTLGGDWRLIYDAPMGEFVLGLYLENYLDAADATPAAEGWGGDRCIVYYNDTTKGTVLLLRTVWDTLADAKQFVDAYRLYADARFEHEADQIAEGLACWQGADVLCAAWEADSVTVALGPDQETVNGVLAASRFE